MPLSEEESGMQANGGRQDTEGRAQDSDLKRTRIQGPWGKLRSLLKNLESCSDAEVPFFMMSTFKVWLESMWINQVICVQAAKAPNLINGQWSTQHNRSGAILRHFHLARNANGPLSELQQRHSTLKDTLGSRNPHVRNKAVMPISTRSSISPSPKSSQQKKAVKYILQNQRRKEPHDKATPIPTSWLNWRDSESEKGTHLVRSTSCQNKSLRAKRKVSGANKMIESLNFFLPLLWSLTHLRQDPFQVGADEVRQGLDHLLQGCQGAEQVDLTRDQLAGASHGCQQWRHQAGKKGHKFQNLKQKQRMEDGAEVTMKKSKLPSVPLTFWRPSPWNIYTFHVTKSKSSPRAHSTNTISLYLKHDNVFQLNTCYVSGKHGSNCTPIKKKDQKKNCYWSTKS